LEGRWAQLAVDAHIAHAIDYSRPIHPLAEAVIFERLEVLRRLSGAALYPNVTNEGKQMYLASDWAQFINGVITPWDELEKKKAQQVTTTEEQMREGIEYLRKLKNRK
jgi:hypothetical protein